MSTHNLNLRNTQQVPLRVWFEPWCEEIWIEPNCAVELNATGEDEGQLEVEYDGGVAVVFGWPSSSLQAVQDGQTIWESYFPHPPIPKEATSKSFIKGLFWAPPEQEKKSQTDES